MPVSEISRLEKEYIEQMESLEVLSHRIQSRKVAEICSLEQDSTAASDGLPELEAELAKLKSSYDQDTQKIHDLEQLARQLFAAADQSQNPAERIKARRAELEVAETRPSILRQSIAIDELEMVIHEKKQRSATAEAKIEALKVGTENDRAILHEVEKRTVEYVPSFSERLPPNTEQSLGNIRMSVENMVSMLLESLEKAESLLETVTEAENKKINASTTTLDRQANTAEKRRKLPQRKTRAALSKELGEVQNKVEEMVPLYWVGHHTRAWRMEKLRSEKAGKKGDPVLAAAYWTAQNEANAKADATMDEDFEDQNEDYMTTFQTLYDIPVHHVWEHRHFTMFIDVVNWGSDMAIFQRYYSCDNFWPFYNKIMGTIYPEFKVNSNEVFVKDQALVDAYRMVESERKAGLEAFKAAQRPRSKSGSFKAE
ncbi:hypothetical protein M7I_7677 [Glarea lozoyensis 74030]|uniref:Uncharacterized protein n=1 Tax=Glarea lozoyensis (strain ATCC 74030 / MF5533) TaxID=1104152 RepID=H0EXY4_GLAL7|nr:hypothetical protein M7I_7677 [Glarea lozoyensis 74030]